jgi:radical SAM protein with 4Fe4S-binding SPASM domain
LGVFAMNMAKYITAYLNSKIRPIKLLSRPINLQLEITTACNSKCQMCNHYETIPSHDYNFMTLKNFKRIIDEVKPLKLNLSGMGESFLNKDLFSMIKYAKSKRISVNFATNFSIVNNKIEKICHSGVDLLKVSLDSTNPKTYTKIRGIDRFNQVCNNIKKLNAFKIKNNLIKPDLRLNFAMQKDNIDELIDFLSLAKSLNIEVVYVQYMEFVNMEYKKPYIVGDLTFYRLKEILENALWKSKELKIRTNIPILLNDLDMYWNKMEPGSEFKDTGRMCHFPWLTTFIEWNGDVRPCQMFIWVRDEEKLGNVLKDGFMQVWNGEQYKDFRKNCINKKRKYLPCQSCIPQTYKNIFYIYKRLLPGWNNIRNKK